MRIIQDESNPKIVASNKDGPIKAPFNEVFKVICETRKDTEQFLEMTKQLCVEEAICTESTRHQLAIYHALQGDDVSSSPSEWAVRQIEILRELRG